MSISKPQNVDSKSLSRTSSTVSDSSFKVDTVGHSEAEIETCQVDSLGVWRLLAIQLVAELEQLLNQVNNALDSAQTSENDAMSESVVCSAHQAKKLAAESEEQKEAAEVRQELKKAWLEADIKIMDN